MSAPALAWTPESTAPCRTVLAVDDDPGLLRFIELRLREVGVATAGATSGRAALEWLERHTADLLLIDFNLPDMNAEELVRRLDESRRSAPFIVITGFGDEQVAVRMMKRGARDYLRKDGALIDLLPTVVAHNLEQIDRERRIDAAEEAFRLLHSAVQQSKDAVLITTSGLLPPGPTIAFVNPAFVALTGYTEAELRGRSPRMLQGARTDRRELDELRRRLERGEAYCGELVNYRKDGTEYVVDLHVTPIRDESGDVTHYVAIERDITERRLIEEQLRQSTKMEAVGNLAGGIAHDFNNMLAVIRGHADLVLERVEAEHPLREGLEAIRTAAEHAAALTRQLLAFGRKGMLQPERLDLAEVVERTVRLLRRLIGENIQLAVATAPDIAMVLADPHQVEQVILNLAINARDAMPGGGTLRFDLKNVCVTERTLGYASELEPGAYVQLAVTDTGQGMDEVTLSRVFEPFFTTKEPGRGTGLGLASVYGIVRQSGGHVRVTSQPGAGTRFEILLPCAAEGYLAPDGEIVAAPARRGTEQVLVVEDEAMVRKLLRQCLENAGYRVLSARDGADALAVAESVTGVIDVLVTDVVMPGLSGPELAARLVALRPETKVLFVSGYPRDAFSADGMPGGDEFLAKPFTPRVLLEKVRALLDKA